MSTIASNPLLGISFHAIGALSSSTCYAPQKKVVGWSWQTYFLTQATFCWFLLPLLGAWLTIPNLWTVLLESPKSAMLASYLLGMAYGIGGMAFNVSIRYIGFSLTYAIAVGLSSVLGTLIPPLINGTLVKILDKAGAEWVIAGVVIGTIGIALCGAAGRLKELNLRGQGRETFSLAGGLLLSLLAGVLSAVYGISLDAGQPIADTAVKHGAGIWQGNVIYIFSNTGAFVTTAIYCLYLHFKHQTLGELIELPAGQEEARLPMNFAMAALTGALWYGQFFFYNLGHVRMGEYKFTSWAIHMIMLVLFSNVIAIVFREWKNCRRSTLATIVCALLILLVAIVALTYGNYLGETSASH